MLKQSSAFRPFMKKSIVFAYIAVRTGKHRVRHIMARACFSTGKRNDMVKVIDIPSIAFLKPGRAVVASIVLRFQFLLYLLRCQCTRNISLLCPAPMRLGTCYYLASVCFIVFSLALKQYFSILFSVFLIIPACSIFMDCIRTPILFILPIPMNSAKLLILRTQRVSISLTKLLALFIDLLFVGLTRLFTAIFAVEVKSILAVFIMRKFCERQQFFALCALLQRNISHDLNHLLFSCLLCVWCQGDKAFAFSHRIATPMLDTLSTIPFFASPVKVEGR